MVKYRARFYIFLFGLLMSSCGSGFLQNGAAPTSSSSIASVAPVATFIQTQTHINQYCIACHTPGSANGVFDNYADLMRSGFVVPEDPDASKLCTVVIADPTPLPALPAGVAQDICAWIAAGALEN